MRLAQSIGNDESNVVFRRLFQGVGRGLVIVSATFSEVPRSRAATKSSRKVL